MAKPKVTNPIRLKDHRIKWGIGRSTQWRMIRDGGLPRPFKLPGSNVEWLDDDECNRRMTKARDAANAA